MAIIKLQMQLKLLTDIISFVWMVINYTNNTQFVFDLFEPKIY